MTLAEFRQYAKDHTLEKKLESVGGEEKADFLLLQSLNLAQCERQTCQSNIVKILGGFHGYDPEGRGRALLLDRYKINVERNRIAAKKKDVDIVIDHLISAENAAKTVKKQALLTRKSEALGRQLDALNSKMADHDRQLDALRASYAGNTGFDMYEPMRDNGIDLARLKYREMRILRKDLQIIFQDPFSSLSPRMPVGEIIGEAVREHNLVPKAEFDDYIDQVMDNCGLQPFHKDRYPHEFSGGQRQRICIARALALNPEFIVCDEPVSALDVSIQAQVVNMFEDLQQEMGLTYLFIAHDLSVVKHISNRIGVMYLGKLVELADSYELIAHSIHPYTRSLISAIPVADPITARQSKRIVLQGDVPSPLNPPSGCRFRTRCPYADERCAAEVPEFKEVTSGHWAACHHLDKVK